jgi:hypothetical protein
MSAGNGEVRWAAKARVSVAACLAGAFVGTGLFLGNQAFVRHTQPTGCPDACVTGGTYLFDPASPAMTSVERAIAAENARAVAHGRYVSVAVLDPFTPPVGAAAPPGQMIDELRGAYLAQRAINARGSVGVQLLLANVGTYTSDFERQAVRQVEALKVPDHLVAVTGMNISSAGTAQAARALSADKIPMVGAATADQFNDRQYPGFEQVTPDLHAQIGALRSILGDLHSAILISDNDASDLFAEDQRADVLHDFSPSLHGNLRQFAIASVPSAASAESALITPQACVGTPPVVFYAGPDAALPTLIRQFETAAGCAGKKITIATAEAAGLAPAVTRTRRGGAQVSVVYSGINRLGRFSAGFVASYRRYLAPLDPRLAGLSDPQTIATYDTVKTAGDAIAVLAALPGSGIRPTASAVRALTGQLNGKLAPYGATGSLNFSSSNGQLISPAPPVYRDANGMRTLIKG